MVIQAVDKNKAERLLFSGSRIQEEIHCFKQQSGKASGKVDIWAKICRS
jgi:hypothetical protein